MCANWDTLCTILSSEYGVRVKVIWRLLFSVHWNCLMSRSPDLVSCQGYLKLKVVLWSVTEIVSCQSNLKQCHVKVTWSGVMSKLPEAVSCQGDLKRCHVLFSFTESVSCQGNHKVTWSSVMSRLPEVESLLLKYHWIVKNIYQQITRQVRGSNIVWQHWPDTPE